MGRPSVEEIEIRVKYNSQGEPTSVTYADGAGCGYEGKPTDLGRPIKDLVDYHLRHCRASHDIRPTIRCGYEVTGQDSQQRQVTLECVLEDHPSYAQHQLQIKS